MKSLLTILLVVSSIVVISAVDWNTWTPLDDYVNRPDVHYSYYELQSYDYPTHTVHVLNMTSQQWMDESFSNNSIWWHYLSIFIPKNPQITNAGYLIIGNGNHNDDPPTPGGGVMARAAAFCENTGAVAAYLRTVPFQPIDFADALVGKVEDFIIGYTWRKYIEDPDEPNPDMVVLLPMAKAAKLALDTMYTFSRQINPEIQLTKFMPTGFSKRGWTTWLLGCTDRRVFAMAPTVFDLLDMQLNLEHHYRSLGGWSWAFAPYWMEDVSRYLYHPRINDLALLIDPLSYNERLTMPKMIISATGDEFFPPDDANFFWDQLSLPKFLQIFENDDHGLGDHLDLRDRNLEAFFLASLQGFKFPAISWSRTEDGVSGSVVVQTDSTPLNIKAWWGDTTNVTCEADRNGTCRRDFRIQTLDGKSGVMWYEDGVQDLTNNLYRFVADKRDDFGYRAFFIEMTFPGPAGYEMRYTTQLSIIPDEFPYPKCQTEEECKGRLI